jgi:hypothetical protein
MPAKRLPYIKLWHETMESDKVRQLSDSQYRTWTYCILAASQLPSRWRFDSLEHAAYLTRRSLKDIKALVSARFLEVRDDGVHIHDASDYQDVYPSDYENGQDTSHQRRVRHGSTPSARTLREDSVNAPSTLPEHSPEHSVNGQNDPLEMEIEIETEIETFKDVPPAASQRPPAGVRAAVPKPIPKHLPADAEFVETLVAEYGGKIGGPLVVREEVEAALNHTASTKCLDQRQYLRTWLNREVRRGPPRHTRAGPTVPLRSVGIAPDVPPDSPFLKFREVS